MRKSLTRATVALLVLTIVGVVSFAQTRIRFARGRTSASVSSAIGANGQRKYYLAARAGQTLSANVSSRNGCVVLGNQQTSTSYVTDSGDNYIDLFNRCRTATRFTVTVSIY
jgi:hypothetical protein